jgi:hypothetical protein
LERSIAAKLILPALLLQAHIVFAQGYTVHFGDGARAQDAVAVTGSLDMPVVIQRYVDDSGWRHRARLIRCNASGQLVQEQELPVQGSVFVQGASSPTGGGPLLVFGSVVPQGGSYHRPLVMAVADNGQVLWTAMPDLGASAVLHQAVGLTGGAVACGTLVTATGKDALVLRFTSTGALQWQLSSGLDLDDEAYGVVVDDHITITGTQSNFGGGADALFMRCTLDGTLLWSTSWGGIGTERGHALAPTADGHYLMAGSTTSFGPEYQPGKRRANLHLVKINANGDTLWTRTFGTSTHDNPAFALSIAQNGDALIVGERAFAGDSKAYAARISPTGTLLWERFYDTDGRGKLLHVLTVPTSDGFVACGWTFGPGARRALLLRRNAQGL